MTSPNERMLRVAFNLKRDPETGYPPSSAETMWAELKGESTASIRNVPFYAMGIAFGDLVSFTRVAGEEVVEFERVVRRSGHSTYRIMLMSAKDPNVFNEWWQQLEKLGCSRESADDVLIAIDIPPNVNVTQAYSILENGERSGIWGFEEGYYHPSPL